MNYGLYSPIDNCIPELVILITKDFRERCVGHMVCSRNSSVVGGGMVNGLGITSMSMSAE